MNTLAGRFLPNGRIHGWLVPAFLVFAVALMTGCGTNAKDDETSGSNLVTSDSTASATIGISLVRASDNVPTSSISSANPAKVIASVKDANGTALTGVLVTFSTGFGVLSPVSGTALTDASGNASVELLPGTQIGAGEVFAKIKIGEFELSARVGYTVASSSAISDPSNNESAPDLGSIEFVSASPVAISLRGTGGAGLSETSTITFRVRGTDGLPLEDQVVDFTIDANVGGIEFNPATATTNVDGLVSTVMRSGTIPTVIRVTATASATLSDNSVVTIQTQSDQLTLSTGIPDQDSFSINLDVLNPEAANYFGEEVEVSAHVADHYNNPVPDGTSVYFTTEGGRIDPQCETVSGACTVIWTSQHPVPDDHRATILATAIGNESFIDINSDGRFNNSDGEPYVDANNNDIYDEAFVDSNGNGIFDEPFTDANSNGLYDFLENFIDHNRNGIYDGAGNNPAGETVYTDTGNGMFDGRGRTPAGEDYLDLDFSGTFNGPGFSDLGEPFIDANENGVREITELYTDSNADGLYTPSGDGAYNGVVCEPGQNCSDDRMTHVRRQHVLIMASSNAMMMVRSADRSTIYASNFEPTLATVDARGLTVDLVLDFSDTAGQTMPKDTTVTIEADAGKISGTKSYTVSSNNIPGPKALYFSIIDIDTSIETNGVITIKILSPKGHLTTLTIPLTV